jgi:Zn finger protein HypA/HybF involved in hydrogenase expression
MPQCDECGHHVTADFHRVFADNQGTLHGCPTCMSMTEIKNGNAAGL